ncbi:hypothetical protein EVAR_103488_1 [Eumeta japonica]|uniref:Uncharacterized protein n=1 Tax=Eumeta variegata TaxID=151549 RepID=A0A4C1ZKA4_EUMVA|nr:hypothetical protein EVAR_103488_1 [Eumeta japonica]
MSRAERARSRAATMPWNVVPRTPGPRRAAPAPVRLRTRRAPARIDINKWQAAPPHAPPDYVAGRSPRLCTNRWNERANASRTSVGVRALPLLGRGRRRRECYDL